MPDITMCQDSACQVSRACYRHMAVPSEYRQSYFIGDVKEPSGACRYLLVIRPSDVLRVPLKPGKLHLKVVK